MKRKPNGDARRLPAQQLRSFAHRASEHVEQVRRNISADRDSWADLCIIPGVNKRWLRAFVSKQIRQPPAAKLMAIELCLSERSRK
jgi:hypothetical protein